MNFKDFTGELQNRLELPQLGEAVRASRATLQTLGERIQEGEATDLASPLPMEIDRLVTEAEHGQRFDYDEFLDRVAERGDVDRSEANYRSQEILSLVAEVVPEGNIEKLRDQLPDEYDQLFELVGEETVED